MWSLKSHNTWKLFLQSSTSSPSCGDDGSLWLCDESRLGPQLPCYGGFHFDFRTIILVIIILIIGPSGEACSPETGGCWSWTFEKLQVLIMLFWVKNHQQRPFQGDLDDFFWVGEWFQLQWRRRESELRRYIMITKSKRETKKSNPRTGKKLFLDICRHQVMTGQKNQRQLHHLQGTTRK